MSSSLAPAFMALAQQMAPEVPRFPRSTPGRLVVDGKYIRYADLHSFYWQIRQLFGDRLYDVDLEGAAPVILDCGAHIGLASLAFKERYPQARIRAYEADAAIAEMCAANVAAFGFDDVTVIPKAVWVHPHGVNFSASGDDAGHIETGTGAIPSVRLRDEIQAVDKVDLLKLDIEGGEFAVIEDCADALQSVRRLMIEVHAMHEEKPSIGGLLRTLELQGFRYTLGDLHAATWHKPFAKPPFGACKTDRFIITVFAWR